MLHIGCRACKGRQSHLLWLQPPSASLRRRRGPKAWTPKGMYSIRSLSFRRYHLISMYMQPVSMHAEMHAIFNLTGMSPSFKTQVQGMERRVPRETFPVPPEPRPKGTKGWEGFERCLSEPSRSGSLVQVQQGQRQAWVAIPYEVKTTKEI